VYSEVWSNARDPNGRHHLLGLGVVLSTRTMTTNFGIEDRPDEVTLALVFTPDGVVRVIEEQLMVVASLPSITDIDLARGRVRSGG